jgi:hypothetical protein
LNVSVDIVRLVRKHILTSRLSDGDIALERYDLSSSAERERVAGILRDLLQRPAPPGGLVWVWMAGAPRSPDGGCDAAVGEQARSFFDELDRMGVDRSRVRLVRKPDLQLGGEQERTTFETALANCSALEILLPIDRTAEELRTWIETAPATPRSSPGQ